MVSGTLSWCRERSSDRSGEAFVGDALQTVPTRRPRPSDDGTVVAIGPRVTARPHRLPGFSYKGQHRYSLTFCAQNRRSVFVDADVVTDLLEQILIAAGAWHFEIFAYCFMPDHLHLLVTGTSDSADLIAFAHDVKQRVAYRYLRNHDGRLWQKGFYDHIVRDREAFLTIAKYILENPVRAGIVAAPRDYPFSGSCVWTWDQLMDLWQTEAVAIDLIDQLGTP
jgi:putative transposase